jgi:hypothetical protein
MELKVSDIVTSLAQGKMGTANEAFARIMASKVNDALDTHRVSVATRVYSESVEEKELDENITGHLEEALSPEFKSHIAHAASSAADASKRPAHHAYAAKMHYAASGAYNVQSAKYKEHGEKFLKHAALGDVAHDDNRVMQVNHFLNKHHSVK